MKKIARSEANFNLWLLIGKVNHSIVKIRQRELTQYDIPVRQLHALRIICLLGPRATLSEVASQVGREINVISRQCARMEDDGLIKRIRDKPKSNHLRLELTEKGLDILKISKKSKAINSLFSSLTEEQYCQMESTLKQILSKVEEYEESQLEYRHSR